MPRSKNKNDTEPEVTEGEELEQEPEQEAAPSEPNPNPMGATFAERAAAREAIAKRISTAEDKSIQKPS